MSSMADSVIDVVGGVDTHAQAHVAAVVDRLGRVLGTAAFPTTRGGYLELVAWLGSFGRVVSVGIEGTGSWGKGLTRVVQEAGIEVVEVIRPNRQTRRRYGKSDLVDAVAAARAVLNGEANGTPRDTDGVVEGLRLLRIARRSAVQARTRTGNQLRAVIATAPDPIKRQLDGLTLTAITQIAAHYRPGSDLTTTLHATKYTLRVLARRWRTLTEEIQELHTELATLVQHAAPPGLLDICGVNTLTATDLLIAAGTNPGRLTSEPSFAALCGVSPIDASSGQHIRHRLNRGGDRQANAALYRIVIVQLRHHQPARDYMTRRLQQGRTKPEIIRCLKRYVARTIWTHLNPN